MTVTDLRTAHRQQAEVMTRSGHDLGGSRSDQRLQVLSQLPCGAAGPH